MRLSDGWSVVHVIIAESVVMLLVVILLIAGSIGLNVALMIIVCPAEIVSEKL